MGWTAYDPLVRDKPLTAKQLAELAKLVRETRTHLFERESAAFATEP